MPLRRPTQIATRSYCYRLYELEPGERQKVKTTMRQVARYVSLPARCQSALQLRERLDIAARPGAMYMHPRRMSATASQLHRVVWGLDRESDVLYFYSLDDNRAA